MAPIFILAKSSSPKVKASQTGVGNWGGDLKKKNEGMLALWDGPGRVEKRGQLSLSPPSGTWKKKREPGVSRTKEE